MPRRSRTHITDNVEHEPTEFVPKHLSKQEFGRRVYRKMIEKGWNQSELARRAGLPRDSISTYVRGKVLPTPSSLHKVAKALEVEAQDLLPNYIEGAIDEDNPSFEMKSSANDPDRAWLRVNRLVSFETGAEIIALLRKEMAKNATADRKRSR